MLSQQEGVDKEETVSKSLSAFRRKFVGFRQYKHLVLTQSLNLGYRHSEDRLFP